MIKTKVAFWRAGFYPANQKSFQKALIGWKKPLLLWSCKQAKYVQSQKKHWKRQVTWFWSGPKIDLIRLSAFFSSDQFCTKFYAIHVMQMDKAKKFYFFGL